MKKRTVFIMIGVFCVLIGIASSVLFAYMYHMPNDMWWCGVTEFWVGFGGIGGGIITGVFFLVYALIELE